MKYYCKSCLKYRSIYSKGHLLAMQGDITPGEATKSIKNPKAWANIQQHREKFLKEKAHKMPRRTQLVRKFSTYSSSERTTTLKDYPIDETDSSNYRKKRKKHSKSSLTEKFRKAKPPTFDGEVKKGEEAEAWLLGLKKYL
jgi:hypothetical protein